MYLRLKSHTRRIISVWLEAEYLRVPKRFQGRKKKVGRGEREAGERERERAVVIPRAACIDVKKKEKRGRREE